MSASHERHSIATRALLLAFTTAVILLNARVLGASGQGEIAWIQLGILVVTGVSGFLAGGAVVYLQREIPLRAMLLPGHTWLVISALLGTWGGISAGFLPAEHFGAMAGLGWLQRLGSWAGTCGPSSWAGRNTGPSPYRSSMIDDR
ncbi:MAG: hypothetical protein ACPF84_08945 [Flavobacteriales bacterium]